MEALKVAAASRLSLHGSVRLTLAIAFLTPPYFLSIIFHAICISCAAARHIRPLYWLVIALVVPLVGVSAGRSVHALHQIVFTSR